jgi:hypothetical protein
MKKETPHSWKRGAGLVDGLNDSGARHGMPTTGRDHRQKRSPKEQSAVSGTLIQVSQVVLDRLGRDHATRWARSDGSAPASKIVEGMGTTSPFLAGLVFLCLRSGSLQPATTTEL